MPSLAPNGSSENRTWGYVRAEHLLELRYFVKVHPLTPIQQIVAWAGNLRQKEEERIRLLEERERKKRRRTKEEGGEGPNKPTDKPPKEPAAVPEPEVETPDPGLSVLVIPRRTVEGSSMGDLLRSSPVADSKITRSTSSKLNHILTEVCEPCPSTLLHPDNSLQVLAHSRDEKFLIFSNSPLTLAMISDGLQLIHISGLLCSSQIKPAERFQRIVTFETSETHRVLLMELKHGARGLSVVLSPTNPLYTDART